MTCRIRIARPASDLARTTAMYCRGLGLRVIGAFENHDGFDGVMIGAEGASYHFEFTRCRAHPVVPAPTAEDLVVFYIPGASDWRAACGAMSAAGFQQVASFNPYWDTRGRTYEDPDGYRIVLEQSEWSGHLHSQEASMPAPKYPIAIDAAEAPPRARSSNYPEPFASRMAGREKRALGEVFGLTNFGVNLTRLAPNSVSALRHAHSKQDEFIYILQGRPTLRTDEGRTELCPGMCAGFKAGTGNGHHLINETAEDVVYLEIGDRTPGDEGSYPDDDLRAFLVDGKWAFTRKDGTPY